MLCCPDVFRRGEIAGLLHCAATAPDGKRQQRLARASVAWWEQEGAIVGTCCHSPPAEREQALPLGPHPIQK